MLLAPQACKVHLLFVFVKSTGAFKSQSKHLFGQDANDARIHLLGGSRRRVAAPKSKRVALWVECLQIFEQGNGSLVTQMFEELNGGA